jgi:hypothetical protein
MIAMWVTSWIMPQSSASNENSYNHFLSTKEEINLHRSRSAYLRDILQHKYFSSFDVVHTYQLSKLLRFCREVHGAGSNDLVTNSARECQSLLPLLGSSRPYLCWSWKLSILALTLNTIVLQFASSNARDAEASSFSFNCIN